MKQTSSNEINTSELYYKIMQQCIEVEDFLKKMGGQGNGITELLRSIEKMYEEDDSLTEAILGKDFIKYNTSCSSSLEIRIIEKTKEAILTIGRIRNRLAHEKNYIENFIKNNKECNEFQDSYSLIKPYIDSYDKKKKEAEEKLNSEMKKMFERERKKRFTLSSIIFIVISIPAVYLFGQYGLPISLIATVLIHFKLKKMYL